VSQEFILEIRSICKAFPGVTVFDCFDFDLRKGEIHCICGENGAGKSTLIKMLSGAYTPDKGSIYFDGKKVEISNPRTAMQMGIQTIYQEHTLYPYLNVIENLFTGKELEKGVILDKKVMLKKTKEVLEYLHSDISPYDIVGQLGSGGQKTVEIARGLVQESKVIILDEPTAAFSQAEITNLLEIVKKLAENGISIIYISHHLNELFRIADRVTVIRDGIKISTYDDIEKLTEEQLIKDMVGRDVSAFYQRQEVPVGEDIVFEARNISGNGVEDISFQVHSSELVGIAGMVGSGRTELSEILFGIKKADSGELFIKGQKINMKTPLSAIANRMALITEDRQSTGLFLEHTIDKNIPIAGYSKTKTPFAIPSEDVKISQKYIDSLSIATPSVFQKVMYLSGGNQQKVVLGKWFATDADIFIFDEPTRGIDVGTKEEIYKIMVELLKQKKAIIMISSDMPELIALSDKVLVMNKGKMVTEVQKNEVSEENILKHSIGGGNK
jgi:ribose transport system ATP-binding protein